MLAEFGKGDVVAAGAPDENMVGARDARFAKRGARKFAEAALHPVAGDGVADLLADRKADARLIVAVCLYTGVA